MPFSSEAVDRIIKSAVELRAKFPDWTVRQCLETAGLEELFIYGDPDSPPPVGFLKSTE